MLLQKHGTVGEIVTAANGFEALEILRGGFDTGVLPQVIISDIEMPVMNGITFFKELEKLKLVDYAVTRIILNSNDHQYDTMDWSVEIPTVVYFPKPLLDEQLLSILAD